MRIIGTCLATLLFFTGCEEKKKRPETAVETARGFIRATLDGRLDDASNLLSADSSSQMTFSRYRSFYGSLDAATKKGYALSSYIIHSFKDINDSVAAVNYSNSFMNKAMDLTLRRKENTWRVDFPAAH